MDQKLHYLKEKFSNLISPQDSSQLEKISEFEKLDMKDLIKDIRIKDALDIIESTSDFSQGIKELLNRLKQDKNFEIIHKTIDKHLKEVENLETQLEKDPSRTFIFLQKIFKDIVIFLSAIKVIGDTTYSKYRLKPEQLAFLVKAEKVGARLNKIFEAQKTYITDHKLTKTRQKIKTKLKSRIR